MTGLLQYTGKVIQRESPLFLFLSCHTSARSKIVDKQQHVGQTEEACLLGLRKKAGRKSCLSFWHFSEPCMRISSFKSKILLLWNFIIINKKYQVPLLIKTTVIPGVSLTDMFYGHDLTLHDNVQSSTDKGGIFSLLCLSLGNLHRARWLIFDSLARSWVSEMYRLQVTKLKVLCGDLKPSNRKQVLHPRLLCLEL